MLFLDQNLMFFPMVILFLDGMDGNWIIGYSPKLCLYTACIFSIIGLNLQEIKVHHSKERKI